MHLFDVAECINRIYCNQHAHFVCRNGRQGSRSNVLLRLLFSPADSTAATATATCAGSRSGCSILWELGTSCSVLLDALLRLLFNTAAAATTATSTATCAGNRSGCSNLRKLL